jgi:hypothetical protein
MVFANHKIESNSVILSDTKVQLPAFPRWQFQFASHIVPAKEASSPKVKMATHWLLGPDYAVLYTVNATNGHHSINIASDSWTELMTSLNDQIAEHEGSRLE